MAYIPPLNGGRINATISGNTAGAGSLVSTGTLTLAGGNNITLSQNGNAITMSAPNISSVAATGAVSIATAGNTVSIGAPIQSNQTLGMYAAGNTTQNSSTTGIDARSLTFNGLGGVSVGYSNGSVQISGATGGGGGAFSAGISTIGNTAGTTGLAGNQVVFSGGNNITLSQVTGAGGSNTLGISAPNISSLSVNGAITLSTNGNTISIGAPAFSAGISSNSTVSNQLILAGGNNITLSQSTNATGATVSINGASNGLTNLNLSAGTTSNNLSAVTFSNSNNVNFGLNGSVVTASVSSSLTNINVSASNTNANLSNLVFANGNGVSFGLNTANSNITASHNGLTTARASNDAIGLNTAKTNATWTVDSSGISFNGAGYAGTGFSGTNASATLNSNGLQLSVGAGGGGGVALANSNATVSNGTANLSVTGGALTISGTGSTFNFSAPSLSSLSATGALSLFSNGNTISIGAPATSSLIGTNGISISTTSNSIYVDGSALSGGGGAAGSIVGWEYPTQGFNPISSLGQSSLSLQHIQVPFNVTGSALRLALSFNVSSLTSSGTTGSVGLSLNVGLYSLNGSTLSSIATGSALNSFSFSSGTYVSTAFNSVREVTAPLAASITPGEYWVGALIQSATSGSPAALSVMGLGTSNINVGASIGVLGASIGASARDVYLGQGIYTTQTTAMPATIPISAINNTVANNAVRAAFYHAIYSANY